MRPVGSFLAPIARRSMQHGVAFAKERLLRRLSLVVLLFHLLLAGLWVVSGDRWGALSHFLLCYCACLACQDRQQQMVVALYWLWSLVTACEFLHLAAYVTTSQDGSEGVRHLSLRSNPGGSPTSSSPSSQVRSGKVPSVSQLSSLIVLVFSPFADLFSTILMYKLHKVYESAEVEIEESGNLFFPHAEWQSSVDALSAADQRTQTLAGIRPLGARPLVSEDATAQQSMGNLLRGSHPSLTVSTDGLPSGFPLVLNPRVDATPWHFGAEGGIEGDTEDLRTRISTIGDPVGYHSSGYSLAVRSEGSPAPTEGSVGATAASPEERRVRSVFEESEVDAELLNRTLASHAYNPFRGLGVRLKSDFVTRGRSS